MKKSTIITSCFAAALPAVAAVHAQETRPNILLIVVDDMGYSDLGCYGSEIHTPSIDRLAREGMRFTHFYSNPRSCPSRASLMTGLYSAKAGVGNMDSDFGVPGYHGFLNCQCVTLAEVLETAGYTTYMTGKWHLGTKPGQWPCDRGFQHSFALLAGGSNYFHTKGMVCGKERIQITDPDFYMTDAISDKAVEYIRQNTESETPFFMYVAYTAPHTPLQARPADIAKYAGHYDQGWDIVRKERFAKMKREGILCAEDELSPRYPSIPEWNSLSEVQKKDWALRMSIYAAMLDVVDQGVGRILTELEATGKLDNTIVMFVSDNGANPHVPNKKAPADAIPGDARSVVYYDYNWANVSNTPYHFFKRWTHEGGISVPLIIRYPATVKAGSICSVVGHFIDVMPTLLDFAGTTYPLAFNGKNIHSLDGVSLRKTLSGDVTPVHNVLCWEHNGNRAVRKGNWKLVSSYDDEQKWELYNLETDRTEMHNLIELHPEIAHELEAEYLKWSHETGVLTWEEQLKLAAEAKARNKAVKRKSKK